MKLCLWERPIFFTSDTHFGHRAMVENWRRLPENHGGGRFIDKDHMDTFLIGRWNETVPPDGVVFLLGDVSFRNQGETNSILDRLNGHIHLYRGNHDRQFRKQSHERFQSISDYGEITVKLDPSDQGQKLVLCHYALRSWNGMHHGTWNLHGHSHGNLDPNGKQLDVGVDCNLVTTDLRPISFAEVAGYMAGRDIMVVDHHKPKTTPLDPLTPVPLKRARPRETRNQ